MIGAESSNPGTHRMRLLFVEDDEALGRGVVAFLRSENFTVDWVTDGETALDQLAEPYSVIVLDLGLPDIGGLEVWCACAGREIARRC
jgi:DNA-binding response OmpR family regulator